MEIERLILRKAPTIIITQFNFWGKIEQTHYHGAIPIKRENTKYSMVIGCWHIKPKQLIIL